MKTLAQVHRDSVSAARPFVAQMAGIGATYHATEKNAKAARSLRKEFANMRTGQSAPHVNVVKVVDFSTYRIEEIA